MPNQPPTELGRELDDWLGEYLMGWVLDEESGLWLAEPFDEFCECWLVEDWTPSTDNGLAVDEVVPAMEAKAYAWGIRQSVAGCPKKRCVEFWKPGVLGTGSIAEHETFAGAIALAAVAALARKGASDDARRTSGESADLRGDNAGRVVHQTNKA